MKTFIPQQLQENQRKWFLIDANWKTLWKISTLAANLLRWKLKSDFTSFFDMWDNVIVINCDKFKLTWNKLKDKKYYRHSRYAKDWLKTQTAEDKMEKDPSFVLKNSIAWMVPSNKLKKDVLKRLKLFVWDDHNHEAQQPEKVEL